MAIEARRLRGDDTRQLLRVKGLRFTQKRMMILRELARLRRPVSHTELTERLEEHALDRTTIYRNLVGLAEAGSLQFRWKETCAPRPRRHLLSGLV